MHHPFKSMRPKLKLEKGEKKDPTVHPARAAGWDGGAKSARIPTGSGQVGHPKAFFGIEARPPALFGHTKFPAVRIEVR